MALEPNYRKDSHDSKARNQLGSGYAKACLASAGIDTKLIVDKTNANGSCRDKSTVSDVMVM